MIKHIGITEVRKDINSIATTLDPEDTISVTNRGKEVLAIIPWQAYEAIIDTIEILSDPEGLDLLKKGIEDYKNSRTKEWDDALKELDLV